MKRHNFDLTTKGEQPKILKKQLNTATDGVFRRGQSERVLSANE